MELVRQMAAVGAVLLLLAATLWVLRSRGLAVMGERRWLARVWKPDLPPARRLECLERLRLSPQHTLHLVRVGESAVLLASTPSGCALLQTIPHPQRPEVAQ